MNEDKTNDLKKKKSGHYLISHQFLWLLQWHTLGLFLKIHTKCTVKNSINVIKKFLYI